MRLHKLLFYLLIISVFLNSCINNKNEEVIPLSKGFQLDDLIVTKLDLMELDYKIMPFYDSLINLVIDCPLNQKKQFGFLVTMSIDSLNMMRTTFECIYDLIKFDYSLCNGIFYYKGYQFAAIGNMFFLKKSSKEVKVVHIISEKLKSMYQDYDDFHDSSWTFIYLNDKFKCISYNHCRKYWFDKKYYLPEK